MSWKRSAMVLWMLMAASCSAAADPQPASAALPPNALYVAVDGNDQWSGRLPARNARATDGPLATLAGARNALRKLKAASSSRNSLPQKVFVRGGKYFLAETLRLTAEDSGTRESPVIYTAFPGEKPVLSGGRTIRGWQPYRGRIMQASLPESKASKRKLQQLFCGGRRQTRARYPNLDPGPSWRKGWLTIAGPAAPGSFTAFKYRPDSFPRRWAKPTEGEVFMIINWGYTTIAPIAALDEKNHAITMARPVRNFARPPWVLPRAPEQAKLFRTDFGYGITYRFFVENLLEELDRPGEWCVNSEEGKLYFWPPEGADVERDVVAPALECLVDLQGASYVTISGLTLTETVNGGDNMHRFGLEGAGAMFPMEEATYCGEAVRLHDAEYCRVEDNAFLAVGGNAVMLEGHDFRNVIRGNEITDAGHCGVVLMGTRARHGNVAQHPLYNQVTDNHIHHCGCFDKAATGVFCGISDGNVIGHNLIEQVPHHAINMGNHGYGRNIIQYNDIRHACQESFDNAAVNCWMEDDQVERGEERSGHVFRYNRIADTPGDCTFGIYLDNFSSNCFVYGNIILRSGTSGIRVNGGKNNIIENNIIVGSKDGIGFWPATVFWPNMKGFMTGNRLARNIIGRAATILRVDVDAGEIPTVVGDSDHNLFFGTGDWLIFQSFEG